jgi:hypothetical protein
MAMFYSLESKLEQGMVDIIPVKREDPIETVPIPKTREEWQELVGGPIEVLRMPLNKIMIVDEHGKMKDLPVGNLATDLYRTCVGSWDTINGKAVIANKEDFERL